MAKTTSWPRGWRGNARFRASRRSSMTWRSSTTSSRSSLVRTATVLPQDLDRVGVEGPSVLRVDLDLVDRGGDQRAAPVEAGVIVPSLLRGLVSERGQDGVPDPPRA